MENPRPSETLINCLCNWCYLKNQILGLDMNLIDLDPHLHFHMELLLYLDLAPDPFMLQPLLPLVQGKINTTRATDRSGSVSPTNSSAPVFPTATPAICAWTRETRSTGWYIVTPICYYSPAERLRLIARYTSHLMKVRLGSIGVIAEPNVEVSKASSRFLASSCCETRRSSWFQKQG